MLCSGLCTALPGMAELSMERYNGELRSSDWQNFSRMEHEAQQFSKFLSQSNLKSLNLRFDTPVMKIESSDPLKLLMAPSIFVSAVECMC